MKTYEKGELTKEILMGLAAGGFLVVCAAMPNLPQMLKLFGVGNARDRYRFLRTAETLQKKKMIRIYRKNGEEFVEITDKGKKQVYQYHFDEMMLTKTPKWDGSWHMVMFDIPESKKRARNALSSKVREIGMYPIQKSVFISPYPCKKEIDFIGDFFGVREHIIYAVVRELERSTPAKQFFGIHERH